MTRFVRYFQSRSAQLYAGWSAIVRAEVSSCMVGAQGSDMRRKTMAKLTIAVHFYQSKLLLPLYLFLKSRHATKDWLFSRKAVPTSLLAMIQYFFASLTVMTLSQHHFVGASNRNWYPDYRKTSMPCIAKSYGKAYMYAFPATHYIVYSILRTQKGKRHELGYSPCHCL